MRDGVPLRRPLRITFLTGSLQAGQDGVGDYTALLAGECRRLGVAVQVAAIADRHLAAVAEAAPGPLRLPHSMPWSARFARLERHVSDFDPDWVSVQFVPYSFQRWGVAFHACKGLRRLARRARLHVMLHEIWTNGNGSVRERALGAAQRWSIQRLCRAASVVHTSNATYQDMARASGIEAATLPLFGSVNVGWRAGGDWLASACASAGAPIARDRSAWWIAAFFGTLHPNWPPQPLIDRLQAAATDAGKRLALVSVGRLGAGEELWERMQATHGRALPMVRVGEQPQFRISELLLDADFGIATTPLSLLGKSATAAAMFEHGLPVIVNRNDGPPTSAEPVPAGDRELVIPLDDQFERRVRTAQRRKPQRRLTAAADQLLADLSRVAA